jgi:hypothetical protein
MGCLSGKRVPDFFRLNTATPMQAFGRNQISVQVSGFRIWGLLTPRVKLNGTIPNRKVIFKDTIPVIEVFRNVKFQAPNSNEIPNFNIQ